jgi:hypothetical protein
VLLSLPVSLVLATDLVALAQAPATALALALLALLATRPPALAREASTFLVSAEVPVSPVSVALQEEREVLAACSVASRVPALASSLVSPAASTSPASAVQAVPREDFPVSAEVPVFPDSVALAREVSTFPVSAEVLVFPVSVALAREASTFPVSAEVLVFPVSVALAREV